MVIGMMVAERVHCVPVQFLAVEMRNRTYGTDSGI